MTKTRARLSILSELLSFPTINQKDWTSSIGMDKDLMVGDLVSLVSAPATKWYVSWLKEIDPNNGWPKYLLESIDDGELCWWENIGLNVYSREIIAVRPTWRWSDKQFSFYDRWLKVGKRNDAYIVLPAFPKFSNDGSVTLDVRIRFSDSDFRNPKRFLNWKKMSMEMMADYYKESVVKYKTQNRCDNATEGDSENG